MAKPGALARTMLALRTQRRTGILTVDAEGTRTFIYLKEGTPIFAEEGTAGETLGRLLVRLKLLSHEQYLEVLSKMTDALVFNEQIRFGETAVELGFLSEEQVHESLVNQVRWKVIRCFQRDEVTWGFEDGESQVEEVGDFPMMIESLVYEAVLWLDSEQRSELALGGVLDRYVHVPAEEREALARRFGIDEQLIPGLSAFDGRLSVKVVLARATSSIEMEALVTAMAMLGLPVFVRDPITAPAAAAPAPTLPSEPRKLRPSKRTPLDRLRTSQVLQRLDSVIRAYKLNDADLFKEPSSPHEQSLLAEQAFQRGRAHLTGGRSAPASRALRRAVQLAPGNHEYALFALWCDLKDRASTDMTAAGVLKRTAVGAVRRDPNFAFGYYVLGIAAFTAKDGATAKRFFRRALALDATLKDAERHLRIIEGRGP